MAGALLELADGLRVLEGVDPLQRQQNSISQLLAGYFSRNFLFQFHFLRLHSQKQDPWPFFFLL